MAKYLIMIYGDEQRWDTMSDEEEQQIDEGHRAFSAKAGTSVLAAGQLERSTTATTLRAGNAGRPSITDGPFLESKEVVGGFYLIEAADIDEAISLVSGLGEVQQDHSGVQIHPLVDHG
jgi:hypothetical protein